MLMYYGVVHGKTVVLPDEAQLPEGSKVEVRLVEHPPPDDGSDDPEMRYLQRLLEAGLITEIPERDRAMPDEDFTPIEVKGKPLSQMIIEDRR